MQTHNKFPWPENKHAAISLTFDDARPTQIDLGIPLLDVYGIKATFYVSLHNFELRLNAWCEAVSAGHEIGNHSLRHPCSGNFPWNSPHILEDYTLEQMETELLEANAAIERLVGVRPETFGYPCGQKFVGRGEQVKSYVPLIARHFIAGRGFRDECSNDPACCDLAQLLGVDFDRLSFAEVKTWLDATAQRGGWLVLGGHEMCVDQRQGVLRETLEETCRHLIHPANGFWVDTVANIAKYVNQARRAS